MTKVLFELAAVGLGGALGSMTRHGVGLIMAAVLPDAPFPWNILLVNVVGCFAIGALGEYFVLSPSAGPHWLRPLLIAGVLGGLTTFSAVGHDTYRYLENQEFGRALLNVGLNLVIGIGAVATGVAIVRAVSSAG